MKIKYLVIGLLLACNQSQASDLSDLCEYVDGAIIISGDGDKKYLGQISSSYDSDSIFNNYGNYGGQYSSNSIWNNYSTYGNSYSTYSPFSEYSLTPPILIKNNRVIGKLTVNDSLPNALNPYVLKACKF